MNNSDRYKDMMAKVTEVTGKYDSESDAFTMTITLDNPHEFSSKDYTYPILEETSWPISGFYLRRMNMFVEAQKALAKGQDVLYVSHTRAQGMTFVDSFLAAMRESLVDTGFDLRYSTVTDFDRGSSPKVFGIPIKVNEDYSGDQVVMVRDGEIVGRIVNLKPNT